ncbi:MAG: SRPBCC domain-containing protein [bacterium]|jgi:activator of HSP90 ATPase
MKDYKNYFRIKADPQDIYACLTNPATIELWSGYPAKMENVPGSEFEIWDGDITGRIISVVPEKEIVQQWYFDTQPEESIVTIKLHPDKNHVSVELRHVNIPDEVYDEFVTGWEEYFFGAIKHFLED